MKLKAHVCILQTTLHLIQNQFKVWIVSDGVSSINKQEIAIALDRMKMAGAFITTSDSILFEILGDSMQPEFKDISKLIKEYKLKTSQALMGLSE